jgi:uncharacterized protein YfkK (UPF0435 family)
VNEKYSKNFSDEQREIIQAYMLEAGSLDFLEKLDRIKSETITRLRDYAQKTNDLSVKESAVIAEGKIKNLTTDSLDAANVKKFLEVSKLKQELMGE